MMDRQLGYMVRLIDDLLDISRINRNKMELRRTRVLLADVVNSAVEMSRPAIEEAEHQLTITLPQGPVFLDADQTRLAQVFSNLLTNGAKYSPRGGHIWLAAERTGSTVVVSVRDTGIGVPANPWRKSLICSVRWTAVLSVRLADWGLGWRCEGLGGDARRYGHGCQPRPGEGQHVYRHAASAGPPTGTLDGISCRQRTGDPRAEAAHSGGG